MMEHKDISSTQMSRSFIHDLCKDDASFAAHQLTSASDSKLRDGLRRYAGIMVSQLLLPMQILVAIL